MFTLLPDDCRSWPCPLTGINSHTGHQRVSQSAPLLSSDKWTYVGYNLDNTNRLGMIMIVVEAIRYAHITVFLICTDLVVLLYADVKAHDSS